MGTAHFHRLGGRGATPLLALVRVHVRNIRDAGAGIELLDVVVDGVHHGCHHTGHATAGRGAALVILLVGAEVDLLLLEGVAVGARCVHLREQGRVGAFLGIFLPLDLHVRDFYGRVLAEGDLEGVLQGEDNLVPLLFRNRVPILRQRGQGQKGACGEEGNAFQVHMLTN